MAGNKLMILVTLGMIKGAHFLIGRYNVDNHLTELTVIKTLEAIPVGRGEFSYKPISRDALDKYIPSVCTAATGNTGAAWNGTSDVNLFFDVTGKFLNWEQFGRAAAA